MSKVTLRLRPALQALAMSTRKPGFPPVKRYGQLVKSVELACAYASRRAWKHSDDPPEAGERQRIADVFAQDVLNQLCEDFEV